MKADVFKREDKYMAGTYVPRLLLDKLNLLSLYLKTPKARVIRELIEKRVKEEDHAIIIHILAQRAVKGWEEMLKKKKTKAISFSTYEDMVEQSMSKKSIAPAYIQQTITEMRRLYVENQRN